MNDKDKAAPVGEREACIEWFRETEQAELRKSCAMGWAVYCFQAGAAYQRAQQPQSAEAVAYKDDPRSPSELSLAGCNCVRYGENNPHWPCRIHTTPQPSAGEVMPDDMRELLEEIVDIHRRRGVVLTIHIEQIADILARLNGKEVGRG